MSILSAQSIRKRCIGTNKPMIDPFYERTVRNGLTFGLDSAGYDIRAAQTRFMWPGRFTRLDAIEEFNIPNDIKPAVCDKSTWARLGVVVQNTRAEPGWYGALRLEVTNHSWWFRLIRKGAPIAQIEFHQLDEPTEQPYRGKYQGQKRGTNAIFE